MSSIDGAIRKVLASGLATQFDVLSWVTKKIIPEVIEQWGKLHCLEGGDIMPCIRSFPDVGTAEMRHLSACVIFFSGKYSISIFCPINSMSNSSIETSTVETFLKFLSYKRFTGNSSTLSSFPFPKAMNFKQRSPKVFVLQLFRVLILISPTLMECRPFHFTCRLGPWTLLTLNVSSALLAVLKTRGDGGWSTAVVC